eukprot:CAMPEP_0178443638 /NCGR_PEP_ID=MMETSP0689_2-20121128/39016_1 /TAXON_ID=160604 /ORGANISM="Amphidinium massartii, Strain CS-259" /LENGTH=409 /DNA_ID=CAMNT_0020067687 /DNA_START=30 /DNA_END=1256 /DNA_ORIENTATION=+
MAAKDLRETPCRYDWLGIHEEMLRDSARVEAYRRAILENSAYFLGKTVLEVGCGTGILSIFAAKAGASAVYAVDAEEYCVEMTRRTAAANSCSDVVHIIVSEWMGYFLFYESMVDAVVAAQARWLKPGGIIFPTVVKLFVAPFCDEQLTTERHRFWANVGGLDFSSLLPDVEREFAAEPRIEGVRAEQLLASPTCLWSWDFRESASQGQGGSKSETVPLQLTATAEWHQQKGVLTHGFAGWFDCHFHVTDLSPLLSSRLAGHALAEHISASFMQRFQSGTSASVATDKSVATCRETDAQAMKRRRIGSSTSAPGGESDIPEALGPSTIILSTAPDAVRTHWHQTLFFLKSPLLGDANHKVEFKVSRDAGSKGWLSVTASACGDEDLAEPQHIQQWLLRSYGQAALPAPP